MDTVFKSLFFRQPLIHYVSPPVCENLFSSSSGPIIVLNAINHLQPVSGFILGGVGNFHLSWGVYPGALCYSVYMSTDPNNPFGEYVIIAECIPNPDIDLTSFGPGFYRVTALTPEGETPFSPPIEVVKVPAQCPSFTSAPPSTHVDADVGDSVTLGPIGVNEGIGFGEVFYWWFKDSVFYLDTTATTQNSLIIDDVDLTDSGDYTLQIVNNNPACAITSVPITLDVNECPTITGDPPLFDVTAGVGDDVVLGPFPVDEGSAASVTYEWYKNGSFYADTSSEVDPAALAIPNAQATDSGDYTLQISSDDPACFVESDPITLNVSSGPEPDLWWPFEEAAGDFKDVVVGPPDNSFERHLFGSGAVIDNGTGIVGNSVRLSNNPGVGTATITAHIMPTFTPAQGLTVCSWTKWDVLSVAEVDFFTLPTMTFSADERIRVMFLNGRVQLSFILFGVETVHISTPFSPAIGDWYFIRWHYNPVNSKFGLQIDDGAVIESVSTQAFLNLTYNDYVFDCQLGDTSSHFGQWEIDETGLWTRKLTDAEVAFIYNSGNGRTYPF